MSAPRLSTALRGLLCLAAVALPPSALAQNEPAYGVLDFRMLSSPADPFPYYVDGRMQHPASVLIGQIQQHVDTAYATWENVACAYPAFKSLGLSSNNLQISDPRDPQDNFNVTAVWITSENDPYYGFALGGGTAAAATVPTSYAGTLYQCDIYLNAVNYQFSTQTPTPQGHLDLQSLILHEVGHCLGLGHSDDWADVMFPSNELGGQRRALTQRDVGAICSLYPQTGAVGSPCNTDPDCSNASLRCVRPPLSDGGMGPPFCSKGCEPNVPGGCDTPYVCKPSTLIAGSNGTCLPSQGDFLTRVGAPCAQHGQCGSAVGLCFNEGQLPSGAPAWKDGYCTQACGAGNTPCPAGAECVLIGGSPLCLKTCRLGHGDCRFGYTCIRATESLNLCVSSCAQDQDCGDPNQFLCRTCDGTCLPRQNATAQVGDLCTQSSQCGPEQFCLTFQGASSGVCSKNCGTACTTCAQGSSCHPLADQNLYCLRDCVQGSCPPGYQCGLLPTGRACIPGCTSSSECPVGTSCFQGQCTSGNQDGGTCALCPADSGVTGPPPPRPDAGAGPGSSGGCGCASSPSAGWLGLPLVLLALGARTRRTGSRR
jgi:hypothetical protein